MSLGELARQLKITPHAVGTCVERGEAIVRKNGNRLIK
jgi:hypothetical protein